MTANQVSKTASLSLNRSPYSKGAEKLAAALEKPMTLTVEGQDGEWLLEGERATTDPRQIADYAARGWRGVGTVRRTAGRRRYTALISADGTYASIIR